MILYNLTIATKDQERLVLTLTQLGCATKPFYLCQVRHGTATSPIDLTQPISLFLEHHRDPTEATNAIVSLARGFAILDRLEGFEGVLKKAHELSAQIQWKDGATSSHTKEWEQAKALFLGFEMEQLARK